MIELARERIATARSMFVLTGAGMSAESGLPTFRGTNGLWNAHRVEELASPEGFARDPDLVWRWYEERRAAHARAQPNAGHRALVALQTRVRDFTLATQNVDSLHLRAGSHDVLELHGHLREARCDRCGARRALDEPLLPGDVAHGCGGRFRPDIVWFGEPLSPAVWNAAARAAARAEVVLVVGTSALVELAASLAMRIANADAFTIEINPAATALSDEVDVALREPAAKVLPRLLETAAEV